jgi:hypothetical protein
MPWKYSDREARAVFKWNARLPSEHRAGFGDVRLAPLGVVLGLGLECDCGCGSGDTANVFRELENRQLDGVPEVHRIAFIGEHKAIEAVHQVADVTETARLRARAEDRHGQAAGPGRETLAPRGRH